MTITRKRAAAAIAVGLAALFLVAGFYLWEQQDLTAQQAEDPGNPNVTFAPLPSDPDTPMRPQLPVPDTTHARPLADGIEALRAAPGLATLYEAIAARDVSALVSLFEMETYDCDTLGRSAGDDCSVINGASDDGEFQAVAIEDGGSYWPLAENRFTALLEVIMRSGTPQPVMATHDRHTPDGEGGVYYLAFEVPAFNASDPTFNYADGVVGAGFGLKVRSRMGTPVLLEFSLLTADWNPLKWTQLNGAPNHELVFPSDLSAYPELYEGFEKE